MDNHSTDAPQPSRRRRRPRPQGRWTNPASRLQAARFAKRLSGKQVVSAIRIICAGHAGKPCRIDVSKLSDYECSNRRPSLEHIEAFCRLYQRSPEQLGLIIWREDTGEDDNRTEDSSEESAQEHTLTGSLDFESVASLVTGLTGGDLRMDADVAVDQALLDLISGTVALAAVATQVLRASLEGHPVSDPATTGAII